MSDIMPLNQYGPGSHGPLQLPVADHDLAEATKLVRSVEAAIRTGLGDGRSNAVILQLLALANAWIDLRLATG